MENAQRARRSGVSRVVRSLSVVALAAPLLLSGCASMMAGNPPVITMSPGWESRFKLDWKVEPESGPNRRITGYLQNEYGDAFTVRLAAHGLDSAGGIVWQRVQQQFGEVPPFERDFFEFDGLPAAERYM